MVGVPAGVRDNMNHFGEWLRAERDKRGWSQAQVAENAETSVPTISRVETGERSPSRKLVTKIATALGADPREALEALMADTPGLAPAPELEPQNELERRAIAAFSKLSDEEQESVLLLVERIAGITKD
jgi:transcriptional regulator with XRE-family HTH domain